MDDIPIDKKDLMQEGSDNSVESTPEAETGPSQENPVQLKRKGGRKPVCLSLNGMMQFILC